MQLCRDREWIVYIPTHAFSDVMQAALTDLVRIEKYV